MAQTGFTPIQLYSTSTAAAVPVAGNLTNSTLGSELAINITDGKLFYKDNANAVQVIGWKTVPTTAGGTGLTSYTAGDLSYYASGTTFTKLAIGASTTILTSTGSAPQWSATSGITVGTATNLAGGLAGSVPYQTGAGATTFLGIGASGRFLSSTGSAPQWSAPAALTETDDTNVTMTLGGTPSTALLSSVSMTLGWTGQLAVGRGGTGLSTLDTGYIPYGNGTGPFSSSANLVFNGTNLGLGTSSPSTGTLNRQLTINSGANNLAGIVFQNNATGTAFNDGTVINILNGTDFQIFNQENGRIDFGTNNTLRARITAAGDVNVVTGNVVISTSGKGIDFSATPGTGTSELLADYEEGDWTPTQGAGLTVVGTFASTGTYTKVGRMVTIRGSVSATTSVACSAAGVLTGGFPFAPGTISTGTAINNNVNSSAITYVLTNSTMLAGNAITAAGAIVFSTTYFV